MRVEYVSDSFKGVDKEENKDSFAIIKHESGFLFFLFDGVSSSKNAKIGVEKSIDYIKKNYKNYFSDNNFLLKELMFDVNSALISSGKKELHTTYVALYLDVEKRQVKYSSLGDSRLYGVSKQHIRQYTKDHSGKISRTITKCLGIKELGKDDFNESIIKKVENKLLLSSDGFYSFLEKNKLEYFKIFNFSLLKNIKKRIKKEINNNNFDDATYILVNLYV